MAEGSEGVKPPQEVVNPPQSKAEFQPKPASQKRRTLLRWMGHAGVLFGLGVLARNESKSKNVPAEPAPPTPAPVPEAFQPPENKEEARRNHLNKILAQDFIIKDEKGQEIISPQRSELENAYADSATTLKEIDEGLSAVADPRVRRRLLEKRELHRKEGLSRLKPLTSEQLEWARSKEININPESLAIATDVYPQAVEAIRKLFKTTNPKFHLPPPETIAILAKYETRGLVAIGQTFSSKVFNNPEGDSKERAALQELAHLLKNDTGLDFDPNKIPSSETGDIGFQFRPSTALEIYKTLAKVGIKFNPFDPESGTLGGYVYLALKGYDVRNQSAIQKALNSWNPEIGKKDDVLKTDNEFRLKRMGNLLKAA